jgi:hypothetical protein
VLEHDPYNLGDLKILLADSHQVTVQASGSSMSTPTGSPTDDEKRGYLRRQVLASPYNADFWEDLAATLGLNNPGLTAEKILTAADIRTNAIAHSNHSPDSLLGFIYQKLREIGPLDSWEDATGVRVQQDLGCNTAYA